MKKIASIVLSILLISLVAGCSQIGEESNPDPNAGDPLTPSAQQMRIVSVHNNTLNFVMVPADIADKSVYIVGEDHDGSVEEYTDVNILGSGSGEFFKVEVFGSVYDFQLLKVKWDEETEKFIEGEVLEEFDKVRNQVVFIETTLPEGVPFEMIKWKNEDGETFGVYIADDGYGLDGSIVWSN